MISSIMLAMMNDNVDPKRQALRNEYTARINCVIDYIESNIDQQLSLDVLATVAGFSPYHFHRIFKALMGETLNNFIHRIRLEKAAILLSANPQHTITEIAFDCGFSSSSQFARAFKTFHQMSASEWRRQPSSNNSKIDQQKSKNKQMKGKIIQDVILTSFYIDQETNHLTWRLIMTGSTDVQVVVKNIPDMEVAYVRHIGPYKGDSELFSRLFERLFKWAGPRELLKFPETQVLTIYHDDPKITDETRLRTSACITVPVGTVGDGDVGIMSVKGGKYAFARFELEADKYEKAWDAVMGGWLPESGFQPDDRLCFELYHNDPNEHPEHKHIVDICIPVKPL